MRRLILMRHAEAVAETGAGDHARGPHVRGKAAATLFEPARLWPR